MSTQNGIDSMSALTLWALLEARTEMAEDDHALAKHWNESCARLNCGRARALHTGPGNSLEREEHSCPGFM